MMFDEHRKRTATAVGLAALTGQEAEGTVARALEFTVRHLFLFLY